MVKYLIDENLLFFFSVGDPENFMHVSRLPLIDMDSDIWRYALTNNVVILQRIPISFIDSYHLRNTLR